MHQSPSHSQGHFSRTLLAEAPHLEQLRLPGLFVRIGVDDFLCFTIVVGKKKILCSQLKGECSYVQSGGQIIRHRTHWNLQPESPEWQWGLLSD